MITLVRVCGELSLWERPGALSAIQGSLLSVKSHFEKEVWFFLKEELPPLRKNISFLFKITQRYRRNRHFRPVQQILIAWDEVAGFSRNPSNWSFVSWMWIGKLIENLAKERMMESLRHEPILLSYPEKSLRKLPTFCFWVLSSVINLPNVLYNTITGWVTWPLALGGVATVSRDSRKTENL